ncbi:hypothetical protein J437_LFUL005459 [Ladona fulva]|uniref:Tyrosine--tRNA ligase n=1 Tax=Ladona fulva TaxID=123851 RepID=A0A8K0NWT5_LADFU|nr:hypothetical protein J437_LFUL005459 [Ladona fulva]
MLSRNSSNRFLTLQLKLSGYLISKVELRFHAIVNMRGLSRLFSLTGRKYAEDLRRRSYSNRNILKLRDRGMLHDLFPDNSASEIVDTLNSKPQVVYAGFDPTADSLHVGNLLVLTNLIHWQRAGHQVISLIGGATAQIGDPSGRTSERKKLKLENIEKSSTLIQKNISDIFENHKKYFWNQKGKKDPLSEVIILDNESWYKDFNVVDFVSEIGRHFRMGTMLSRTSVQSRLASEAGLSFSEFSYQMFQAYDWLHLLQNHNCKFQIGGSDQMGNIVAGHDLIGKVAEEKVYGKYFRYYKEKPELRIAQKKLAENVTLLVHGEEGLKSANLATSALYDKSVESLISMSPSEVIDVFRGTSTAKVLLSPGLTVLDMAMSAGCFANDSDAKRIISAGGFYVNHQRITNFNEVLTKSVHILPNNLSLIRVGKKKELFCSPVAHLKVI